MSFCAHTFCGTVEEGWEEKGGMKRINAERDDVGPRCREQSFVAKLRTEQKRGGVQMRHSHIKAASLPPTWEGVRPRRLKLTICC